MARIRTYPNEPVTDFTGGDQLLGTNIINGDTANFTIEDLATFLAQTSGADPSKIGFQFDYIGMNPTGPLAEGQYVFQFADGFSNTDWRNIIGIRVSTVNRNGVSFRPVVEQLRNQLIKITDLDSTNSASYGIFRVGVAVLSGSEYTIPLAFASATTENILSNGIITITPSGIVPGDTTLIVSNFDIIQGTTAIFPQGPQGEVEAADGALFLLYDSPTNPTIYRLYGPKVGPVTGINDDGWGNGVSLIGADGATGATGPIGATGPTGPRGRSLVGVSQDPVNPEAGEDVRLTFFVEDQDSTTGSVELPGTVLVPGGERGANGLQGVSVLSASTSPSNPAQGDNIELTLTLTDQRTLGPFTIPSGTQGADGAQGRYTVQLFLRASTAPTVAPTVTWTEATNTLSNNADGWSLDVPAGDDQLYEVTGAFDPALGQTTITRWSIPFQAGATGPAGTNGVDGMDGQDGADGQDGTDGANFTGVTSTGGTNGVTVQPLANGQPVGSSFIVPNGAPGLNGTNGTDGTDGTDGRGITGIRVVSTDGLVTNYEIDFTDNLNPFFYSITDGRDGRTVLSGSVDPDDTDTGSPGDFYINFTTNFLFGPKNAANVWPRPGTSLVGPRGARGDGVDFGTELPATGTEGQLFSLDRFYTRMRDGVSEGFSPSIYRWIGTADDGDWTDDHFIVRQNNLNIPDAYNSDSAAFLGRTIWFQNDGSNANEDRVSGLYRWNGGGPDAGDTRWELVTATEAVSTVRYDQAMQSVSRITDLNFIGNNVTVARREGTGNEHIVDVTIGGTTPPPPPEFLTAENLRATPAADVDNGPVTTDVTLTPTWTVAEGASVLTANITGPGISGAMPAVSGTPIVLPAQSLALGSHVWTLGIIGTDSGGNTITTPVTVTATITVTQPPRTQDNARAGLNSRETLEAGDLLEFSTARIPRPGSIEATTSTEVGLAYIWVLLDRDVTSVVISDIQPIPFQSPVSMTIGGVQYMAYRSTAQVADDGTSTSNFQLNLTQYNQ